MTKILIASLMVLAWLGVAVEDDDERRRAYVKCFVVSLVVLCLMS